MELETTIELYMEPEDKHILWGIMHHHVKSEDFDSYEVKFRNEILRVLDPDGEYLEKYNEIQNSPR